MKCFEEGNQNGCGNKSNTTKKTNDSNWSIYLQQWNFLQLNCRRPNFVLYFQDMASMRMVSR